jgi:diguanylate cyclase (GGDEF)-like protein/PAS domain S-box-containing protein
MRARAMTAETPPQNKKNAGCRTRYRSLSDPDSLREFANKLREGIYIVRRDGGILDANPAFLTIFGATALGDFDGLTARDLFIDPARRAEEILLLDRDGSVREFELTLRRLDGEPRTVLDTCYTITDPETGEEFIHGIIVDITSRKQLEARLRDMSTHDPLTGALNRRYLAELEERFVREPDFRCGCIYVDIDHFKRYNDASGHQAGDDVLKHMTRFLMRKTRADEAVLRVGGDEFVVILHNADATETKLVADRLRAEGAQHAPVPFSLGWAVREPVESVQRLLDRADKGMLAVRVSKRQSDPRLAHAAD